MGDLGCVLRVFTERAEANSDLEDGQNVMPQPR